MNLSIIQTAEQFVRTLLGTRLDAHFAYHNVQHTQRVVEHAGFLALEEGLTRNETEVLILAAWFHDTGYVNCYAGHEVESAQIATGFLKSEGYPDESTTKVQQCILSTREMVAPGNLQECILHDADYYHLFLNDYFISVANLRRELAAVIHKQYSDSQWWNMNGRFLACHTFYTSSDKARWSTRKEQLLKENERLLVATYAP